MTVSRARKKATVPHGTVAKRVGRDVKQRKAPQVKPAKVETFSAEEFDAVIAVAFRAQADALDIEAQTKRRPADEYDAAQTRGEVAGPDRWSSKFTARQ